MQKIVDTRLNKLKVEKKKVKLEDGLTIRGKSTETSKVSRQFWRVGNDYDDDVTLQM